jgi:DNA-binding transcriptional ArsR family regulator
MTATVNDPANDGLGLLTSPVRRLIVDTLANRGAMTAAELGQAIDLHATTVRFHLDQLLAADLLTTRFLKTRAVGRPRKLYDVAPGTLPDPEAGPESLKLLTSLLADSFGRFADGSPITPAEAGERGGPVEHVTAEPGIRARDHARPVARARSGG